MFALALPVLAAGLVTSTRVEVAGAGSPSPGDENTSSPGGTRVGYLRTGRSGFKSAGLWPFPRRSWAGTVAT